MNITILTALLIGFACGMAASFPVVCAASKYAARRTGREIGAAVVRAYGPKTGVEIISVITHGIGRGRK